MLAHSNEDQAFVICERVRKRIAEENWALIHPDLKVTLSIGVCADISLGSAEAMLNKADDALYYAKRNGKNRVCIWETELVASG